MTKGGRTSNSGVYKHTGKILSHARRESGVERGGGEGEREIEGEREGEKGERGRERGVEKMGE